MHKNLHIAHIVVSKTLVLHMQKPLFALRRIQTFAPAEGTLSRFVETRKILATTSSATSCQFPVVIITCVYARTCSTIPRMLCLLLKLPWDLPLPRKAPPPPRPPPRPSLLLNLDAEFLPPCSHTNTKLETFSGRHASCR